MPKLAPSFLAGLALIVMGCGSSDSTARLAGTIAYADMPMEGGKVLATRDGLQVIEVDIIDGKYLFPNCPQGAVRLAVFPPAFGRVVSMPAITDKEPIAPLRDKRPKIKFPGGTPLTDKQKALHTRYKDFPGDYRDFDRSSLRVNVVAGDNQFNMDLKPTRLEN